MWINPGEVWQYLNTIVKLRTVLSGPKLDRSDGSSLHSESHLSRSIQFTQSQVFEDFAPAAPHLFTAGDFFWWFCFGSRQERSNSNRVDLSGQLASKAFCCRPIAGA